MKQGIIIFFMSAVIMVLILMGNAIQSKSTRRQEVQSALRKAVDNTVECLKYTKYYTQSNIGADGNIVTEYKRKEVSEDVEILSDKELVKKFMELFMQQIKSNSKVTVHVITADYKKGLIDVQVTEEFTYENGKSDQVVYRRACILDCCHE